MSARIDHEALASMGNTVMKNHIIHFEPNKPYPGHGVTHIKCIEESSRVPEAEAIAMRLKCGMIRLDEATNKWEDHVPDRGNTHPQAQEIIKNKVRALNGKMSLDNGGDPSAVETWQHEVGLISQNGKVFKQVLRIGGFSPLHMR